MVSAVRVLIGCCRPTTWRSAALNPCFSGIVVRVDVRDGPRPQRTELEDGLARHPAEVRHLWWHGAIRPGFQCFRLLRVEGVAHPEIQDSGDHSYSLLFRMPVRRHTVTVGHLEAHRKESLLG